MILLMKVLGKRKNNLVLSRKGKKPSVVEAVLITKLYGKRRHAKALLEQFEAALGTARGRGK